MQRLSQILGAVLVLFGIIHLSLSIQCYVCSSRDPSLKDSKDTDYGEYCNDPFNVSSTPVPLVDCDTIRNVTTNPLTNYTDPLPNVCLKLITASSQVTENRKSEVVSTLTSRLCGHTGGKNRCVTKGGASSDTTRCYCDDDGCNSAHHLNANVSGLVTAFLMAAAMFLCQSRM